MANAHDFWTAERIALLKRLRDDGVAYAAIASRLGVTRSAISGKVDRLGWAVRERVPRAPRKPRPVLRRRSVGVAAGPIRADGAPPTKAELTDAGARPADVASADVALVEVPRAEADGRSSRPSSACGLLDLDAHTCRWPLGDPGEPDFFFCGELPAGRGPYCTAHRRLAYRPFDTSPISEFEPERERAPVLQPDTRFGQFAAWDVT